MQLTLADFLNEQYERQRWTPPAREILRRWEMEAAVRPIYAKGDLNGRERTLRFLREHHYLQRSPEAKEPNFTWVFGLFLRGELAGVVCLNPPAAGVPARYFGKGNPLGAGLIGISRTCCHDAAPYNAESFMVAAALRMLPRLDHRFHTVIAQSDLTITDEEQRTHCGILYMGCNGWWAGYSTGGQWRGFYDPLTGARMSRKVGGRDRTLAECPDGWLVEPAAQLSNFLWFVGREEAAVRERLAPAVRVLSRQGLHPVWRHPGEVEPGTPRAYSARDKARRRTTAA